MVGTADLVMIVAIVLFVITGIRLGLVHTVGSLVGIVAGAFVATHYGAAISAWSARALNFDLQQLGKWVMFLIIFLVVSRLVGFGIWMLEKSFGIFLRMPFLNSLNRMLGGVLGFFEGALVVGIAVQYAKYLPVPELGAALAASKLSSYFVGVAHVLWPLIPEAIKTIAS